jgi:flagellar motor switch protein FliN
VSEETKLDVVFDMEMEAALHFGTSEVLLKEVLALGPGDVVELDRQAGALVDLVVGGRIVARGEVVVVKGNFALRVTEVATPQLRLEGVR